MEQLRLQIGAAVRAARKRQKNLTQEKLAESAGVSMETISNVERGATLPTIDVLFKIARVLPLDLAALAKVEPGEGAPSTDRVRLEGLMAEEAQTLPDDKLRTLIEIGRVLERGA